MSVIEAYAETMYMNSNPEELNWGRWSEPHEALCSKRKHDILEPDVGSHRQRSQKKADASVLQNFFAPCPSRIGIYHVLAKSSSSDEIMQNEHPPRGSVSFTNQNPEKAAQ